jgi:invasion protein IalB
MNTKPFLSLRLLAKARIFVAILTAGALLAACSTMQQVQSSELPRLTALVQIDDTVTCTLTNGSTKTIKVTAIEADPLIGENNQRVFVADISRAEIKRLDVTKSVLLGLAVAAGVTAAAAGGHGGGY